MEELLAVDKFPFKLVEMFIVDGRMKVRGTLREFLLFQMTVTKCSLQLAHQSPRNLRNLSICNAFKLSKPLHAKVIYN